jgi:hypothetical protein
MVEVWKPVTALNSRYEASSLGRIRRATPANATKVGRVRKLFEGGGYLRCSFFEDGKVFCLSAHRVVWEAFHGPIPEGLQLNHKNGQKFDNRLDNLELCTASENKLHSYRVLGAKAVNTPRRGEANNKAKLKASDIPRIRQLAAEGWTQKRIGVVFGVCQPTIGMILRGRNWAHVT